MASEREDTTARVRRRVRELRTAQGLTLDEVAARAGMDPSTLSRLESGARRLAVDHLTPLAQALGVTVDELVVTRSGRDPRVRARPPRRDGMTVWPLTRSGPAAGLHAFKLAIPADRTVPDLRTHEGYEWVYVLAGRLRLVLGDEEFVIDAGEAVEFSTWTAHWLGAADGPVEVLAIFGPHGERVHLRSSR
jgi:transcriptional regulator with XRE-family HTH domain